MEPRLVEVTTAGGNGAATGSAFAIVHGSRLRAVSVDYDPAAPATTVVTITNPGLPGGHTIVIPAGNTDRIVYPRVPVQDPNSGAIAGRGEEPPVLHGKVLVTVTLSNALTTAAAVRLFLD